MDHELADHVRRVIDANRYMALGTVDDVGHPWVSPVWFASEDHHTFHWVSSPDAKHSRNLSHNPEVAIAIYDSSVPVGGGQAVYMKGAAWNSPAPSSARASRSSTGHPKGTSVAVGN